MNSKNVYVQYISPATKDFSIEYNQFVYTLRNDFDKEYPNDDSEDSILKMKRFYAWSIYPRFYYISNVLQTVKDQKFDLEIHKDGLMHMLLTYRQQEIEAASYIARQCCKQSIRINHSMLDIMLNLTDYYEDAQDTNEEHVYKEMLRFVCCYNDLSDEDKRVNIENIKYLLPSSNLLSLNYKYLRFKPICVIMICMCSLLNKKVKNDMLNYLIKEVEIEVIHNVDIQYAYNNKIINTTHID